MTCPHAHEPDQDTAARYVSGTLTEAEQADFEAHFFGCAHCFADVQTLQAARDLLARPDRGASAAPPRRRRGPGALWALAAAASVGFALIAWTVVSRRDSSDTRAVATRTSPTPEPGPSAPATPPPAPGTPAPSAGTLPPSPSGDNATPARLRELALVVAPPFVRLATRSESTLASSALTEAMTHYAAGRYDAAAGKLRDVVREAGDTAAATQARFFLGICALKLERHAEAQAALGQAAESRVLPYADEAHFYLAKAAIAAGDLARARRELQTAIDRDAGPDGEAARLLARLEQLGR